MKILAIIPARGGSKGIPKKNIVNLAGKPLIEYTVNEAKKVKEITNLIVSTDDYEIKRVAELLGAEVPFLRPKKLSTDKVQTAPVIFHGLEYMEKKLKIKYDAVLILQPTTPFRKSTHIKYAIKKLTNKSYDSVVSVVMVKSYHPFRMKRIINNYLTNYIDKGYWDMRPRQELPPVYIRNGCIYLIRRNIFYKNKVMIGDKCYAYIMNQNSSINIDNEIDLMNADQLLNKSVKTR